MFHQIPVEPDDVAKISIITRFGLFEYLQVPFILKMPLFIAAFFNWIPFCSVYLDDILIFSPDNHQHTDHLITLLQRLSVAGATVNPVRCEFGSAGIYFFGNHIDVEGIGNLPEKVRTLANFLHPSVKRTRRRLLRFVNYYRRFAPRCATGIRPLPNLLSMNRQDKALLAWWSNSVLLFAASRNISLQPHFCNTNSRLSNRFNGGCI